MENNNISQVFQVLDPVDLATIDGGAISKKSLLIGIAITLGSPVMGAGYWFGYFVNS